MDVLGRYIALDASGYPRSITSSRPGTQGSAFPSVPAAFARADVTTQSTSTGSSSSHNSHTQKRHNAAAAVPTTAAMRDKHEARLRVIRRNNSERARRYRKRKKEQTGHTVDQIGALRDEIAMLVQRKQLVDEQQLAAPFSASTVAVKMVQEYVAVFRFGMPTAVQSPTSSTSPRTSSSALPIVAAMPTRHEAFMRAMAHPDVVFGDFVGVHPLLDQWQRYSSFHSGVRLEIESVRVLNFDACPVVSTTGTLHLRYSRRTLEQLFPHALAYEALVQQLVGREVHLGFSDTFYFDAAGQMIRYELVPGLVSALHDVVGNLRDVALLLGDARIESDAVITQSVPAVFDADGEMDSDSVEDCIEVDCKDAGGSRSSGSPIMDIQFILS